MLPVPIDSLNFIPMEIRIKSGLELISQTILFSHKRSTQYLLEFYPISIPNRGSVLEETCRSWINSHHQNMIHFCVEWRNGMSFFLKIDGESN